jgi:ComF family protein
MGGFWRGLTGARCPVCACATGESGPCPECAKRLAPRLAGYCTGCGALAEVADQPAALCSSCRIEPRPWDALGFYGEYAGALRDAVLLLKFGGRLAGLELVRELAWRAYVLHRERMDGFTPEGPDLVAAVPMHWRRLLTRGYNQSVELARGVAKPLGVPLDVRALRKVRHTETQSRLGARERKANLTGAFAAEALRVVGKNVLVVDDVMTTGATLEAASRALRLAGARRVEVLVLARD